MSNNLTVVGVKGSERVAVYLPDAATSFGSLLLIDSLIILYNKYEDKLTAYEYLKDTLCTNDNNVEVDTETTDVNKSITEADEVITINFDTKTFDWAVFDDGESACQQLKEWGIDITTLQEMDADCWLYDSHSFDEITNIMTLVLENPHGLKVGHDGEYAIVWRKYDGIPNETETKLS